MDAQNEGMGDTGEWREFVLRMLLREFVEKAGRAETVEDLANTRKALARRFILRWLRRALTLAYGGNNGPGSSVCQCRG